MKCKARKLNKLLETITRMITFLEVSMASVLAISYMPRTCLSSTLSFSSSKFISAWIGKGEQKEKVSTFTPFFGLWN